MDKGLRIETVSDEDQPISQEDREIVETAFEIIEQQLGGKIEMIVARRGDNSYGFMEPNHGTPDMHRILAKLARLVLFASGGG